VCNSIGPGPPASTYSSTFVYPGSTVILPAPSAVTGDRICFTLKETASLMERYEY